MGREGKKGIYLVGKVIKDERRDEFLFFLFFFLLKATGILTNGYIASDFKMRYLQVHTMYSRG